MQNPTPEFHLAIRRPVTVAMIFLGAVVFGIKSYQELPRNLMPDLSYPAITVRTEYPEAAPEEVEKFVSRPLEEALGTVSKLLQVQSVSRAGLSEVMLEFTWGTKMDLASLDVREKMDRVLLPEGVSRPSILRYNPALDPVLRIGIHGDPDLVTLRRLAEREIKPAVEGLAGVASVRIKGGLEAEVLVEVDEGRLAARGLSLEQVSQRLRQENINLAGGSLREGRAEYLVRTLNELADLEEIGQVVIGRKGSEEFRPVPGLPFPDALVPGQDGAEIRLRDVAEIRWGHKKQSVITRINRRDSVEVEIYQEADSNTVEVSGRVKDVLGLGGRRGPAIVPGEGTRLARTLRRDYPGVRFQLVSDPSRFIESALREVRETAIRGGLLALAVLYFFLRDLKVTLIIGVAIPVSVLLCFIPMFGFGVSLNMMSLGGLALGIGMLVDNSIVVLESIFRCREEGDGRMEAADRGTREVLSAICASTLTTVAVFFPIVFVKGIAGQVFRDLALTVTFSLLGSLLVAIYLIPMLASRRLFPDEIRAVPGSKAVGLRELLNRGFRDARAGLERLGHPARWAREAKLYLAGRLPVPAGGPTLRAGRAAAGLGVETGGNPSVYESPRGFWRPWLRVYGLLHPFFETARFLLGSLWLLAAGIAGALSAVLVRLLSPLVRLLTRWLKRLMSPALWLFGKLLKAVDRGYPLLLDFCLRHRGGVILVCLLALVLGLVLFPRLGAELIPRIRQGQFALRLESPVGTPLEVMSGISAPVEEMILAEPEVGTVFSEVGSDPAADAMFAERRGENSAEITVTLEETGKAALQEDALMDRLRARLRDLAGLRQEFVLPSLFSFKTPVEVEIEGNDLEELRRLAAEVESRLRGVAGLADHRSSTGIGSPEVKIEFDQDRLARFGLDASRAAGTVQAKLLGRVSTRLSDGESRYDIRVRADPRDFRDFEDLRNLKLDVGAGRSVPLESLARLSLSPGPSEIRRVGQQRVAVVSANLEGLDLSSVSRRITEALSDLELPPGTRVGLGGQNREMRASFGSLRLALLLAVFLVYIVMASQFESLLHPLAILLVIPLGMIAVVCVLLLAGTSLSVVVFIGAIVLAGIMVNNAIVLVDYINRLRRRGLPRREAVVLAGRVRLRPILMTTLTTILGLLPMALGFGEGAEIRVPMAVTVIAGLGFSTVVTLVVIPVLYTLLDRKG